MVKITEILRLFAIIYHGNEREGSGQAIITRVI